MEADRDEAWDTFIHLKRIYTVREIKARVGYILHDLHNDDIPVEIVEFASSQAGGDSTVIGSYPGNRPEGNTLLQVETATASEASISPNEVPLVQAAATPSNAEELSDEEGSLERAEEETQESERKEEPGEEDTDPEEATPSEAEKLATPSNAQTFSLSVPSLLSDDEEDGDGSWTWDGVQEESEVEPIDQDSYDSDHTGHTFVVRDHRTEGELHINKRDLELYEEDEEDSYGKSQGDATLEGAVYGLYAAEDIVHPDGKQARFFPRENWSPLPQRIKMETPLSWSSRRNQKLQRMSQISTRTM